MTTGNEALKIVNRYREHVEDRSRVEALSNEFPSYAQLLGKAAAQLFRADLNETGAFKWRGAIVGATLLAEQGVQHIIVPSAGNHARGAVWAARELGLAVTAVVPTTAPAQKSEKLRELWDDPRLTIKIIGESFDESLAWALTQTDGKILHPFGELVIPGQGTVVDDVLARFPDVKSIVTAVGGGGLAAGMLRRLEELARTDIEVIGAEAEGSNSARKSLAAGDLRPADAPNLRYGGSAVRTIGQHALDIFARSSNFQILPVPERDVDELIEHYTHDRKQRLQMDWPNLEPTSLVAIAAMRQQIQNEPTVVIATGHNDVLPNLAFAA
jgi:threonine dehydratase